MAKTQTLASVDESSLLELMRQGDEHAFRELVCEFNEPLLRLAMSHVPTREIAEEVVQATWVGVITGIDRFEGRSSLKTWIFRILVNQAKTRGVRESRTLPASSLGDRPTGSAVSPDRFRGTDSLWVGHWTSHPIHPSEVPGERLVADETLAAVDAAVQRLPELQRQVIVLRDLHGFSPSEICELLGVTEGNQRVLLHRARSQVRSALERYLVSPEREGGR